VPTRVLLEGPAIEPLLAQVRQEYGSGVRIISADKVRSGGFGGFFAKQHYELSVEVPDNPQERTMPQPKAPTVTAPPAPAEEDPADSLEQLLARAESRDRISPDDGSPQQPPAP
jgi:flagellar biosynthesis GTPase FlhF